MTTRQPLRRSRRDRLIGGVLGGIAEYYDWDPVMLRIVYVIVSILSAGFPDILIYIAFWIVVPDEY